MQNQKGVSFIAIIIAVAFVAIIAVGGVFAYQYLTQKEEAKNAEDQELIGGDKDSHGCLIAAGYSWCEEKQKCLRTWEEECEADETAEKNSTQNTLSIDPKWILKNSLNVVDKTFRVSTIDGKTFKIIVTDETKIFNYPAWNKNDKTYISFSDFIKPLVEYDRNKNQDCGTPICFGVYPEIKGVLTSEGVIEAQEISSGTQE